jgi:hypothetical protein
LKTDALRSAIHGAAIKCATSLNLAPGAGLAFGEGVRAPEWRAAREIASARAATDQSQVCVTAAFSDAQRPFRREDRPA